MSENRKGKCKYRSDDQEEIKEGYFCYGCGLTGGSCEGYADCQDYEEEE